MAMIFFRTQMRRLLSRDARFGIRLLRIMLVYCWRKSPLQNDGNILPH